jgi:NitT/TauT family transport system ATP-binding protein
VSSNGSMLVVDDATIRYTTGGRDVLACDGVNFSVPEGSFIALVGQSGCGKTSLLYAMDGLIPLSRGRIVVNGETVDGPGKNRALVFQSPTLFPWRNVLGNITYGVEGSSSKSDAEQAARDLVDLVGLSGFEKHHPHELSGGMQQRVNLARALAVEPDVLLLDEPFSALDAQTRENMQRELLRIWRDRAAGGRNVTMIFVTHDIPEAVYLADRVIVLGSRPGRVRADVTIDFPRPRELDLKRTAEFQEHVEEISSLLESGAAS